MEKRLCASLFPGLEVSHCLCSHGIPTLSTSFSASFSVSFSSSPRAYLRDLHEAYDRAGDLLVRRESKIAFGVLVAWRSITARKVASRRLARGHAAMKLRDQARDSLRLWFQRTEEALARLQSEETLQHWRDQRLVSRALFSWKVWYSRHNARKRTQTAAQVFRNRTAARQNLQRLRYLADLHQWQRVAQHQAGQLRRKYLLQRVLLGWRTRSKTIHGKRDIKLSAMRHHNRTSARFALRRWSRLTK